MRARRDAIIFMEEDCPMRWNVRRVLTLAALIAAAGAPASAPAQQQRKDSRVKPAQSAADPAAARIAPAVDQSHLPPLLKEWERRSTQLKSLDVTITRTDKNPAWGEDEHYQGRALLMSPDLAWLDFQKFAVKGGKPVLNKDGKPVLIPYERIICTGQEVWQYRSDTKQIFIYPLEKQAQKRALEEGPLPFLFNFRESEARQRYEMELMGEQADHYWIAITPRLAMDKDAFSMAFVKLDRRMLLPLRIVLKSPDGHSSKDFVLKEIDPTKPVMRDNFVGGKIKDWQVIDNREGPAAQARPKSATPARPVPQPALKPGGMGGRRN
jgi:TIGR03009 family protein